MASIKTAGGAAAAAAAAISKTASLPAFADTTGRAIHIRINPRPANIAESRQILRRLKEFGDVVMYKHLKHEPEMRAPNSALAIFRSKEAASDIVNESPIVLPLETPRMAMTGMHTARSSKDRNQDAAESTQAPPIVDALELHVSPSTQNHAAYIARQHYTGRFQLNTRTVMGADLENRVPLLGLADCRVGLGEVPLRLRNLRAEEEKKERRGVWWEGLSEMRRRGLEQAQKEKEKNEDGSPGG